MEKHDQGEPQELELFLAGQMPAPGRYRNIETGHVIEIREGEALPATFNGRVACYRRATPDWGYMLREKFAEGETDT